MDKLNENKRKNPRILIIANAHIKGGMSGSDSIYMNFAKYWPNTKIWTMLDIDFKPFSVCYITRIVKSIWRAVRCQDKYDIVYTSSDFLMDSIPGFILKCKGAHWAAGFYLFAPKTNPVYYWTQKIAYKLINTFSCVVLLTSEPDRKMFRIPSIVVKGGLDSLFNIEKTQNYDAVYIGRLHPQKGVIELINIWRIVLEYKPDAKLAIIGDGPLESELRAMTSDDHNSFKFFGYLDGIERDRIICSSKIVVHPATYDSGGMAAAQAMAYGVPGVCFDIPAMATYYPVGMTKVKCFDHTEFAKEIYKLLTNKKHYEFQSQEAKKIISKFMFWKDRSELVYYQMRNILQQEES